METLSQQNGPSLAALIGLALGGFSVVVILMGWLRWTLRQWPGKPKIIIWNPRLCPSNGVERPDERRWCVSVNNVKARGLLRLIGREAGRGCKLEIKFRLWGTDQVVAAIPRGWENGELEEQTIEPNDRGYTVFVASRCGARASLDTPYLEAQNYQKRHWMWRFK